ncbi:hypothetical protein BYT27DRAFT_7094948 [Phlegmacium glaucopus]|nr:hypothetical protein BYT27DRAFT_7094948 [Phlegmacium glaucopus]
MSLDPSWRPAEDEQTILKERTWLGGMILAAMAYGIVLAISILSLNQLIRTTTKYNYIQRRFFIVYVTLMFILGTLFIAAIARVTQLGYIDYRLFPGGPAAFQEQMFFIPVNQIATVSYVVGNWLADGMVIYRYMIIYKSSCQLPFCVVMTIPVLAYMASVSLSIVWFIQVSSPGSSPWSSSSTINFTVPYFWMSLSFNISMTIAICARLFYFRCRISRILGSNYGMEYTSVAAIIVESSFLCSVFTLLFLIPFALNHPIQNVFIQLIGEVQIIAPLLITYRVANGAAWVSRTSADIFRVKETQPSGARVQADFSGPYTDRERPPNPFILDRKSDIP